MTNMRKSHFIAHSLIFLFMLCNANDSDNENTRRIVGGIVSENLPWFVTIEAKKNLCGGSVIAPFAVLTAGHCFRNFTAVDDMYVLHGTTDRYDRQIIQIRTVIIHPNSIREWDGWRHNDIAVVFIEKPIKDVVFWLWHDPCKISTVWAAGFGGVNIKIFSNPYIKQEYSTYLKKTSLKVIEPQTCDMLHGHTVDYDYIICTLSPGTSTCQGDSGGPIYGIDKNHDYVLYGVNSFGKGCADDRFPHINMLIWPHIDWIYNTIRFKFKLSGVWRGL